MYSPEHSFTFLLPIIYFPLLPLCLLIDSFELLLLHLVSRLLYGNSLPTILLCILYQTFFCLSRTPLLVLIPFFPSLILTFHFLISPSVVFTMTKIYESSVFQFVILHINCLFFFSELSQSNTYPCLCLPTFFPHLILVTKISICRTPHVSLSSNIY